MSGERPLRKRLVMAGRLHKTVRTAFPAKLTPEEEAIRLGRRVQHLEAMVASMDSQINLLFAMVQDMRTDVEEPTEDEFRRVLAPVFDQLEKETH